MSWLLNIQKDESIHSFIYRTHVVNGVSDFSNIIATSGYWKAFPKILNKTLHLYQPIDDFKFLNLLRDIDLAPISEKIFGDPFRYHEHLLDFFGQCKYHIRVNTRTSPIRYCLHCIENQIQKLGFGFINVNWTINTFCPTHQVNLHEVTVKNREGTVIALACILRGKHPRNFEQPKYKKKYFEDRRERFRKKKCDYVAPCLADELKILISENIHQLPIDLLGQKHRSISYLTTDHMMTEIYLSAQRSHYKQFQNFWTNFAELKVVSSGVVSRNSVTEEIYKNKKANCLDCKHTSCFSNVATDYLMLNKD